MRPVREITAREENLRIEGSGLHGVIRRDPVEPEPVGTIVLRAFHVTGYDRDCDGALMARLVSIDMDGMTTGWKVDRLGLFPTTTLVVTPEELRALFAVSEGLPTTPEEVAAAEAYLEAHPVELPESLRDPQRVWDERIAPSAGGRAGGAEG